MSMINFNLIIIIDVTLTVTVSRSHPRLLSLWFTHLQLLLDYHYDKVKVIDYDFWSSLG